MSHDPLCPIGYAVAQAKSDGVPKGTYLPNPLICLCDHNLRVREDERMRDDDYAYVAKQSEAEGYAAALRDAVAAIYRTCGHTKYEGCSPCPHDEAVTAIKALRKEQK